MAAQMSANTADYCVDPTTWESVDCNSPSVMRLTAQQMSDLAAGIKPTTGTGLSTGMVMGIVAVAALFLFKDRL